MDSRSPVTSDPGQEGWTLERATRNELHALLDLLNQGVETTPDWVELSVLQQAVKARSAPAPRRSTTTIRWSDVPGARHGPFATT